MEPRRHSHSLPGGFMGHVSHSNGAQECTATHSLMGFHEGMSAIQMSPGGAQPLTPGWDFMGHVSLQWSPRCTATHCLDGISWGHVSHSNGAQEVHSHSLLMDSWGMSAIQMEPRRCTPLTS